MPLDSPILIPLERPVKQQIPFLQGTSTPETQGSQPKPFILSAVLHVLKKKKLLHMWNEGVNENSAFLLNCDVNLKLLLNIY